MNKILKEKLNSNITNMINTYLLPLTNQSKNVCLKQFKNSTWLITNTLNLDFFNSYIKDHKIIKIKSNNNFYNVIIIN